MVDSVCGLGLVSTDSLKGFGDRVLANSSEHQIRLLEYETIKDGEKLKVLEANAQKQIANNKEYKVRMKRIAEIDKQLATETNADRIKELTAQKKQVQNQNNAFAQDMMNKVKSSKPYQVIKRKINRANVEMTQMDATRSFYGAQSMANWIKNMDQAFGTDATQTGFVNTARETGRSEAAAEYAQGA